MAHPDEPGLDKAPRALRGRGDASPTGGEPSPPTSPWERRLLLLMVVLMVVFSAPPLVNLFRGEPNKDYSLWYQVGAAVRDGLEVYPDPDSNRLFPFMYPPSAAALLGYVSYVGPYATGVLLVLVHSIAWLGAVILSVRLATGGGA